MRLTASARHSLPPSAFAGPDESYPVDTVGRAVAAKGRSTQAVNSGRMSESAAEKIKAKANRVLKLKAPKKFRTAPKPPKPPKI